MSQCTCVYFGPALRCTSLAQPSSESGLCSDCRDYALNLGVRTVTSSHPDALTLPADYPTLGHFVPGKSPAPHATYVADV